MYISQYIYLIKVTKNSQTFFTQMTSSATNGGLTRGALLQVKYSKYVIR